MDIIDKTKWKKFGRYNAKDYVLLYNIEERQLYKISITYHGNFSGDLVKPSHKRVLFEPGELAKNGLALDTDTDKLVPIEEILGDEIKETKFYKNIKT